MSEKRSSRPAPATPAAAIPEDDKAVPGNAGTRAEQQQARRRTAIRIVGIEGLEAFAGEDLVPPDGGVKTR